MKIMVENLGLRVTVESYNDFPDTGEMRALVYNCLVGSGLMPALAEEIMGGRIVGEEAEAQGFTSPLAGGGGEEAEEWWCDGEIEVFSEVETQREERG